MNFSEERPKIQGGHGIGLYARGIHYTTDPSTAADFGMVNTYSVNVNNPKVVFVKDYQNLLRQLNVNGPVQLSNKLLNLGYDALVVVHHKKHYFGDLDAYKDWEGNAPDEHYLEFEVIML